MKELIIVYIICCIVVIIGYCIYVRSSDNTITYGVIRDGILLTIFSPITIMVVICVAGLGAIMSFIEADFWKTPLKKKK